MKRFLCVCLWVCGMAVPALAGESRDTLLTLGATPRVSLDLERNAPAPFAMTGSAGPERLRLNLAVSPSITAGPTLSWSRSDPLSSPGGETQGTLEFGGFLEYALDDFRFDGSLRGGVAGRDGFAGKVGAAYQSQLAATGTTYRVRIGSEWAGSDYGDSYFSVNPVVSGFGMTDLDAIGGYRDVNVALSFSHPITPNLYVAGTAGAKRVIGETAEGASGTDANRFHLGAGLGLRF